MCSPRQASTTDLDNGLAPARTIENGAAPIERAAPVYRSMVMPAMPAACSGTYPWTSGWTIHPTSPGGKEVTRSGLGTADTARCSPLVETKGDSRCPAASQIWQNVQHPITKGSLDGRDSQDRNASNR